MDNITAKKKAYDLVIKAGGKGTFDQFNASLDNPDNRRKAYEIVTKAGGRGSFPAFEKALGYGGATPPTPPASSRIPDIPEGAAVHVGSPLPPGTVIIDPETGKPSDTIKTEPTPAQPINYVEQNPLRRMDDTALNRRIAELSDKNRETEDYNRRVESENRRRRYSGPGGYYGLASMLSSANRGTLDRHKPVMLGKRENPYAAPPHDLQGDRFRRDRAAAASPASAGPGRQRKGLVSGVRSARERVA